MRNYLHIIAFSFLLCCFTCAPNDNDNDHYRINFYNNTGRELYVTCSKWYPDTTIEGHLEWNDVERRYHDYRVKAYRQNKEPLHSIWDSYEEMFEGDEYGYKDYPNDTMMVFVFDADIIGKRIPDSFRDSLLLQEAFMARYDLSLQDLQRLNWTLSYPPTENMKTIKMWPNFFQ